MTDEQLRTAARRVLGLVASHYTPRTVHGKRVYLLPETMPDADEMEAAAVAILREEMGKAAESAPTQSFVSTADAMQQSIARTIEGH